MATNHTENYQLNLWEPTDQFLRTEFNENSEKIDAALKAEADARAALAQTVSKKAEVSALNHLSQAMVTKAELSELTDRPRMAVGTYTGTGKYGKSNYNRLYYNNTLCARPKLLIIMGNSANYSRLLFASPQCEDAVFGMGGTHGKVYITWWSGYLDWYCEDSAEGQMNSNGVTYTYFAFV